MDVDQIEYIYVKPETLRNPIRTNPNWSRNIKKHHHTAISLYLEIYKYFSTHNRVYLFSSFWLGEIKLSRTNEFYLYVSHGCFNHFAHSESVKYG